MTAEEVKEAWRTGGFVEAPWKKGYEGVMMQAPDGALTPIGGAPGSVDEERFPFQTHVLPVSPAPPARNRQQRGSGSA